jgi:hypothetical protein
VSIRTTLKTLAVILVVCLLCGAAAESSGFSPQPSQPYQVSDYNRDLANILNYLDSVLTVSSASVRLSYSTKCTAGAEIPPIPPLRLRAPSGPDTGYSAVRMIFEGSENVVVSKNVDGIITIKMGTVRDDLLRAHIHILRLPPTAQYNPGSAIDALENTVEVQSAMDSLGLRPSSVFRIGPIRSPGSGKPHIPPVLKNVTVDQVLDLLAKTFRGIVTYGVCTQGLPRRTFFINFAGLLPEARF